MSLLGAMTPPRQEPTHNLKVHWRPAKGGQAEMPARVEGTFESLSQGDLRSREAARSIGALRATRSREGKAGPRETLDGPSAVVSQSRGHVV